MIVNIHERRMPLPLSELGSLLETLATDDDHIWRTGVILPIELDKGLSVGSRGGHGLVRYRVAEHQVGHMVRFDFERASGLRGWHGFEVIDLGPGRSLIRHTVRAKPFGITRIVWPVIMRPLHDAAIEEMFDHLEAQATGQSRPPRRKTLSVRLWTRLAHKPYVARR